MLESNKRMARVCILVYIVHWAIIGASLVLYEDVRLSIEFESKKALFAENLWCSTMAFSLLMLLAGWLCSGVKPKDLLMLFIHGSILYGVNYMVIEQESFILILLEVAEAIVIEFTIIVISDIKEMKSSNIVDNNTGTLQLIHKYRGLGLDGIWHSGELRILSEYKSMTIFVPDDSDYFLVKKETLSLCSGERDKKGVEIYQGDVLENGAGLRFEVRYGTFAMYCPVDDCMMESVGFYTVADGYYEDMPLGPTEDYATIIGNIHDNPELKVDKKYRCFAELN